MIWWPLPVWENSQSLSHQTSRPPHLLSPLDIGCIMLHLTVFWTCFTCSSLFTLLLTLHTWFLVFSSSLLISSSAIPNTLFHPSPDSLISFTVFLVLDFSFGSFYTFLLYSCIAILLYRCYKKSQLCLRHSEYILGVLGKIALKSVSNTSVI